MRSWYLNYHVILPPGTAINMCLCIGSYAQALEYFDEALAWLSHAHTLAADPNADSNKRALVVVALCTVYIQRNTIDKAVELLSKYSRIVECGSNKMAKALFAYVDGQIAVHRSQAVAAKYAKRKKCEY